MGMETVGQQGSGGTDLETTELHQHNDQSTQSRPKPEGSGKRVVCYKQQEQKKIKNKRQRAANVAGEGICASSLTLHTSSD